MALTETVYQVQFRGVGLLDEIAEFSEDKQVRAVARMAKRRGPGRPTKLNRVIASAILKAVLDGNYIEPACWSVGIDPGTYYNWSKKAKAAIETGEIAEADVIYVQFFKALKMSEGRAELSLLRRASNGEQGWQAAMTVLERKYPNRWGRQEKRIHSGDPDRPIRFEVETSEERRLRVAQVLQQAGELDPVVDAEVVHEIEPSRNGNNGNGRVE